MSHLGGEGVRDEGRMHPRGRWCMEVSGPHVHRWVGLAPTAGGEGQIDAAASSERMARLPVMKRAPRWIPRQMATL
eukprot:365658-Chlamydomonas_euryale.AAC.4